uniref:hypothetical protein n=1 Tax=uncultured Duncaniella sp. TaxID=2768039 RepID=UPI0025A60475
DTATLATINATSIISNGYLCKSFFVSIFNGSLLRRHSKMQNYKKSATKRLTVPAYLFISIDFGLVRALYMPDKLNLSNMWEGEKKNPSGVIFFERTRFSYLTDL